jgi:hypothetical protein
MIWLGFLNLTSNGCSGTAMCVTKCMRMVAGCKGPDCLGKQAQNWRCAPGKARGVTCGIKGYWLNTCQGACVDLKPLSLYGSFTFLKGIPCHPNSPELHYPNMPR